MKDLDIYTCGNTDKDFLQKRNLLMGLSNKPFVMFLNRGLRVFDYEPALEMMRNDKKIFAVTFNTKSSGSGKVTEAEFANGGSSIYRRSTWNRAGGINLIYEPAFWDDVDLSEYVKRAGYKIIEDGRIWCIQLGEPGIEKLKRNIWMRFIERRNYFIYLMINRNDYYDKVKWTLHWLPFILWAKFRYWKFTR